MFVGIAETKDEQTRLRDLEVAEGRTRRVHVGAVVAMARVTRRAASKRELSRGCTKSMETKRLSLQMQRAAA
jgi:hypothetical protein